ncbi:helix-hairpin-helix domain-containing protein [Salinicoccus siamensis]|uniref:Helix-hairpin-helix domain-containing protein n=1 Tax=Salinicoccus siamensis TaxID=381830 RepID=A0ABV5Z6Q7_9STAP
MNELMEVCKKYKVPIACVAVCLMLSIIVFRLMSSNEEDMPMEAYEPKAYEESSDEAPNEPQAESQTIMVEVKGAVKYPGVFEVPEDARVKNVLEMAQIKGNADLLTVNQSMKLKDEQVVYVPAVGEEITEGPVNQTEEGEETKALVNINTADVDELTTLNGIGEKKAQLFLDYREENGLFMKLEDIKNIPGIGDKTFESLKPYITIDE